MRNFFLILCVASACICESSETEEYDAAKIAEAMGHLIGKNLQDLGLNIDIDAVVKGMKDAAQGKNSPLSEDECVQAIASLQEESLSAVALKNLEKAVVFLQENQTKESVVCLEDGKIQYKIEKEGEGQIVQHYNSPLIRYTARYLDGPFFATDNKDELISLDEAIPGIRKGILGMKEGEKRVLYIHPSEGYGKTETMNPNSLLIFEVELIKADASAEAHAASNSDEIPQMPASTDTMFLEDQAIVR